MSATIVAILDCGHSKIVITKKVGDTVGAGDVLFCMDCGKKSKVVSIR